MPRLHHCLVCLIAAIMLGTSLSLVPLLLVSRRHHLACHSVLLCLSSSLPPSPHTLHRHRPVHLVPITLCPSSLSPCAPRHRRPAPLVAVTLRPSSPSPCSPHCHRPAPLAPSPSIAFGPCASLATLVPVLAVFWTQWSLRAYHST